LTFEEQYSGLLEKAGKKGRGGRNSRAKDENSGRELMGGGRK
jgi:hypothetical protein